MKKHYPLLLASLVSLSVFADPLPELQLEKSPNGAEQNVLVLLIDDLGWTDLGAYGSQYYESPNIDALASQSRLYTQAYSSSPVCSPSRAALMTGKHPSKLKITTHFPGYKANSPKLKEPWKTDHLALTEFTLAEAFKSRGYATFLRESGIWEERATCRQIKVLISILVECTEALHLVDIMIPIKTPIFRIVTKVST
ncbi:sulfatase-like hydrolase/transferase [Shewanella woodyi]|uniref:sulfatase-like hydrolase/transferase n=1 Tax=Shewanella woodyi TaxID=60961 RepID=UPI00374A83EC